MNGFELTQAIHTALSYAEMILVLIALILLAKKHALGQYKSLAAILMFLFAENVAGLVMAHLHPSNPHFLYEVYFYWYWAASIVGAILMLIFCCGILTLLFSSFRELRSISVRILGGIVFLWCVVPASLFFTQHMGGAHLLVSEAIQLKVLEGGISLLTAAVVFVCIRPLGLGLRSRLPAFGLGLTFCAMEVFSGHLFPAATPQQYNWILILGSVALCAQLICWVTAILWSEAARQLGNV